jgi:hypothetical protein
MLLLTFSALIGTHFLVARFAAVDPAVLLLSRQFVAVDAFAAVVDGGLHRECKGTGA